MRLIATLLGAAVLAGCNTPGPQLKQTKDSYNSNSQYTFGPLYTKSCGSSTPVNGRVDIRFIGADDSHVMSVNYTGHGWLFLDTTLSVDMLIDGKSTQLAPINSPSRNVVNSGIVSEGILYPVTKDVVKRLAEAKSLQFRILGSKGSLEQCLAAEDLRSIKPIVAFVP